MNLGPRGKKKTLIVYPVGQFDHAILAVLFDGEYVKKLEVCRATDRIDHEEFSKSSWKEAKAKGRLALVHDLIAKGYLNGKKEKDVIKLLDKPDGKYTRKYGYTILKGKNTETDKYTKKHEDRSIKEKNTEIWKKFKHPSGVFTIDVPNEWGKGIQFPHNPNIFTFQPTNTSQLTISITQNLKKLPEVPIKFVQWMFPFEIPISEAKRFKGDGWNSIRQDFKGKKNGKPWIWIGIFYGFDTNIIAITLSDSKENIDNHKLIFEKITDSISFGTAH